MNVHRPPTALLAERDQIPLLQPSKIRDAEFLRSIRAFQPDAGVVVAYGRILPDDLLALPAYGFVNVHASILPFYRGAAPIQRAIEHGERETGISIMQVDREMDHGPVYAIERTPIGPDEHAPDLSARLAEIGAAALVRVLTDLENDAVAAVEQDHARATLAPKIDKSEAEVAWTDHAKLVYDKYRAFDPWPGVSVMISGEPVRLLRLEVLPDVDDRPGTLVEIERSAIVVAAGSRGLRIDTLQRPGRGPVNGADFVRGLRLAQGTMPS